MKKLKYFYLENVYISSITKNMCNNSPDSTHILDDTPVIKNSNLYNNQLMKNLSYKQKLQLLRLFFSVVLITVIGLCIFLFTQESSSTNMVENSSIIIP